MPLDDTHGVNARGARRDTRHVYYAIVASLFASFLLATAFFGPQCFRAYGTIKKQFDTEQEYVERVKKAAEGQ